MKRIINHSYPKKQENLTGLTVGHNCTIERVRQTD